MSSQSIQNLFENYQSAYSSQINKYPIDVIKQLTADCSLIIQRISETSLDTFRVYYRENETPSMNTVKYFEGQGFCVISYVSKTEKIISETFGTFGELAKKYGIPEPKSIQIDKQLEQRPASTSIEIPTETSFRSVTTPTRSQMRRLEETPNCHLFVQEDRNKYNVFYTRQNNVVYKTEVEIELQKIVVGKGKATFTKADQFFKEFRLNEKQNLLDMPSTPRIVISPHQAIPESP